ncbi:MAG TPA: PAS domain-containing protein, partial [Rhodocyclaceae bacterium]|nr:PAS domain-containing protein [Rhodocyclaceae bacterium]
MDSSFIARPIRILVVEDDPDDYRLIKTQIGLAKLADLADDSVIWAKTLLTGIDLARDKKPDVVLLDLTLPDSFGMTTLQATHNALNLPIVILTGHDDHQLAVAMLQAGAEDYLVKSQLDANTLRRAVRNACIHHQLKQELEESRHRLELALDGGNLGLWDWDIVSGRVGFNARLATLVGTNPNELGTHVDDWRQRVHRADWPKILMAMNAHLKGETPAYDVEYRILHQDGHWVWVHDRGKVVERNAKGKPTRLIGTQSDIGARKRTELELSIAATAFEVQEGIFITDGKGAIERVNRAFTAITGYDATEALGNNPRMLSSQRHDAAFYQTMWHAVLHDGHWQGEIWNRRKNGEIYPGWLTITAIQGDNGEHIRYVATLTDITIRKAAEDEIRQLAFYDPLTNLPNRRLLLDHLQKALGNSNRTQRCGALLFIDLDNFKTLNDTLGHDKGDLLLQQVAQRLAAG